jgi:hypothetical protein
VSPLHVLCETPLLVPHISMIIQVFVYMFSPQWGFTWSPDMKMLLSFLSIMSSCFI